MKKNYFLLIAFFLLLIAFFFWKSFHNKSRLNSQLTPITLALDWTPNTNHTGIYVAQAKSWYQDQGISLNILPYSSEVTSSVLVTSGKADVGISAIEDVVGETAKNNPLVSIAAILQHNTSGFIVLKDSGITRPKQLDGKIYGGYGSPFENQIISEIIRKDGGRGDFKNIVLEVSAMQGLQSKRIDFVWVFAGWELIQAKLEGLKFNFFPLIKYGIPDSPTVTFVATPKEIKDKPALLKKFMATTAKGYEYARKYPQESAQILINETPKDTFPDQKLVFASQEFLSRQYADPNRKWGLQESYSWQAYPQFILNSNVITDAKGNPVKTMNFDTLFTNKFLP